MKKCPSCESELSPQARFCPKCGALQPYETPTPLIPPPPPLTPPPPPPEWNGEKKEDEDEGRVLPLPEFWENKPNDIRSTGRLEERLHSEHLRSQQLHGDHLQPEESHGLHQHTAHSNHLQLEESHGLHQRTEGVYNLHQQTEETYNLHQRPEGSHSQHQQPEKVHRHHQRPQEGHSLHQQPEEGYRLHEQPEESHSLYSRTIAAKAGKVGSSIGQQWVIIAVVAAVVLGASGILASHLFPHQPTMSVGSAYNAPGGPVGAAGTTLHVHGQGFAANSPITFQLDSASLNTPQMQSDGNGNLTTDLAVTSAWSIGRHTLTAHDTNNAATKGVEIEIVQPGQSNTPGPNGAPADDASFTIQLNIQGTAFTNDPFLPNPYTLIVTRHPDPEGGTVCASRDDGTSTSGQGDNVSNNGTYTQTATYSCSGTYKGGKVSYSEILQTHTMTFSSGSTCNLSSPQPLLQITGSYTNEHNFSGSVTEFSIDSSLYACTPAGSSGWNVGETGTWNGTVSQSYSKAGQNSPAAGSNCTPQITSVSSFAAEPNQTANITGSCFGTNNTFSNADSQYFKITMNASTSTEWHACYTGDAPADSVTCTISSWTDTSITFSGFNGEYGSYGWAVNQGDHLTIQIWNPQTNQGPGACIVIAGGGSTSQCS
jgi:hypothetical protein